MEGEHTIQHSATPRSRIWSDMGIKVPYKWIGKGATEIIEESTNMETVKI